MTSPLPAKRRLIVLLFFCLGVSSLILTRAAFIQLVQHSRLEGMAKRQFISRSFIRPERGVISDRNGEALAINLDSQSLAANPLRIKNKKSIAKILASITRIPYPRILGKLSERREFVWLKRHLSSEELKKIKRSPLMQTEEDGLEGLWFIKESNRIYPHGQLAGHLLGDVNVDAEGIEGIELWYNEKLRGKVASVSAIKDALGRPTFIDSGASSEVQNGEPLTLTIDSSLQYEVEQILSAAVQKSQAKNGIVIVMDAENGEILALANEPGFNPNSKLGSLDRRRNRAITDGYEPGSTLKAILLVSALSHGWKLTDELWGEKGSFVVQGHRISESEAHERFEWLTLQEMMKVSSNVVAAKLALKVGSEFYQKTLRSFGFGAKTGVGFPGEMSGRLPPEKKWTPLTLANVGFGQGLLVTPLQMIRAYAALANGGWLVQPRIVLPAPGANLFTRTRIFSPRIAREVIQALEKVTEEGGTGRKASVVGYRIAGKTGTAQMVDPATKRYSKEKYNPSFIGFPLDVGKKIVIFSALGEPKGNYYAAQTAVPLFREVLERTVRRCSLPMKMDLPQHLREPLAKREPEIEEENFLLKKVTTRSKGQSWTVPSLKGLTPREALSFLRGYPLKLDIQGNGIIVSQIPEPGKEVAEGALIQLHLAEP